MFLSKQSGVGFNEEIELYKFSNYTQKSLNLAYPMIIQHKTYIMPFQDIISYILYDIQANGDSTFSLEKPTPIDPYLEVSGITSVSASISLVLANKSKSSKTPYKKSKGKRVKEEENDSDEGTLAPKKEKLDLATAISGFSHELTLARKAKEAFLSYQQKALQLLEREYKSRLIVIAFIDGCTFLQDKGNVVTFTTLTDIKWRDWQLEVKLVIQLEL